MRNQDKQSREEMAELKLTAPFSPYAIIEHRQKTEIALTKHAKLHERSIRFHTMNVSQQEGRGEMASY